jgi:RNA-directed DNA polymerase
LSLLHNDKSHKNSKRSHVLNCEVGNGTIDIEVTQSLLAGEKKRALPEDLMERICNRDNLNKAYLKVKRNKGAAGIDGMTIEASLEFLKANKDELITSLFEGSYKPQAVRGVEIPKANGGSRLLGIPTVVDRIFQQAILQILQPYFETTFSDSSYGFRPERSAHDALKRASQYVADGRVYVVDMDLEKFFDRVNHDILMSRLSRHIKDKRLLRVIRAFLNAGMMSNGVVNTRTEGVPQGSPLSPLLSNILLTELDRELEERGHKFVRFADDCNIYVRSEASAKRVLESVTKWLERVLKLKINKEKSAATAVDKRKFLGYQILQDGSLCVAKQSIEKFRSKIKFLSKRRTPISMEEMILKLNPLIRGWLQYFRFSSESGKFKTLDGWIRRRLRCFRLQQCKLPKTLAKFLIKLGVSDHSAWATAYSGKGKWRLSRTPQVHQAMNNKWLENRKLLSLATLYQQVNV